MFHSFANNTTDSLRIDSEATTANSNVIWHYRLGHAHPKLFNHVLELCNIHVNNKKSEIFCHACCRGKSPKLHLIQNITLLLN